MKAKTIGFTGTRVGMSAAQCEAVTLLVIQSRAQLACHGDCVGADEDFDGICRKEGVKTVCLPCTFSNMRAYSTEAIAEPVPPMQRNRAIVAQADMMIACPPNKEPIKRGSGTWATIGFARRAGKPLAIVFPDGEVVKENFPDESE